MESCDSTRAKIAGYNMPDVLRLFDVSVFCLMYEADLTILTRDMTCRTNWWENRLYGRLLGMTMLECVEDIPAMLGKSFRQSLSNVLPDKVHLQRISSVSKSLSDFRKNHGKQLREIRQVAAAHRDHDVQRVETSIEHLDVRQLTVLAGDLSDLLGAFERAVTEVLLRMNMVREVLRSFSNS